MVTHFSVERRKLALTDLTTSTKIAVCDDDTVDSRVDTTVTTETDSTDTRPDTIQVNHTPEHIKIVSRVSTASSI